MFVFFSLFLLRCYKKKIDNKDIVGTFAALADSEGQTSISDSSSQQNTSEWGDDGGDDGHTLSQSQYWSQSSLPEASQNDAKFSLNTRRRQPDDDDEDEEKEKEEEGEEGEEGEAKEKGEGGRQATSSSSSSSSSSEDEEEEEEIAPPAARYVMYDTVGHEAVRSSEELHRSYFFVLNVCASLVEVSPFRLHWVVGNVENRLVTLKPATKPVRRGREKGNPGKKGDAAAQVLEVTNAYCHQCRKTKRRLCECPKKATHRFCESCVTVCGTTIDELLQDPSKWLSGCPVCNDSCVCAECRRKRRALI